MKNILDIFATTINLEDHFDVLSCFLHSGSTLYAVACDGVTANINNQVGKPTNEFWNEHFITAFFLFRHALELAIKALIKEIKKIDVYGHNIKKMWEENIPDHENILPEKINKAFNVLANYNILEDAQLFRYHIDKGDIALKTMQPIKNDEFDALSDAAWAVRQLILECIHFKKKLPI